MAYFPDDVLRHVFSYLPQETLVQCRFLSRSVEPLATALAFHSVRLEGGSDVSLFLNVARSERLRPFVRELTVDLPRGEELGDDGTEYAVRLEQLQQTLMALPLARLFRGLRTLNLRFDRSQTYARDTRFLMVGDEEARTQQDLAPQAFTTIYTEKGLQVVSGCWTKEAQEEWELDWRGWSKPRAEALARLLLENPSFIREPEPFDTMQEFPDTPMNLTTLTISNLSEQDSDYLMSSPMMKRFIETQSLSTLQLLTTLGRIDHTFSNDGFTLQSKYKFGQNLPLTWLSPPIADRLRTLSLFAQDYWGWCPKVDFRVLSQGPNGTGSLPNLRTLALGKYVFSHQWQVDWVAQLGSDNGRGGLEELYLDNCPILWRGRVLGPVDGEGFPQEEVMTKDIYHPIHGDPTTVDIDLRWSSVLNEWREKMPSLKVFRMGTGDWDGEFSTDVAMAQTASLPRVVRGAYELAMHRSEDTQHLNYNKAPIEACYKYSQAIIRDGVGLSQKRACLLQYVHFEIARGSSPWVERDFKDALINEFDDGYQRYQEARHQDEDALYALHAAADARSGFSRQW